MADQELRAGQFYAAKYEGKNGDLIVGKIESVRNKGSVVLVNMLSGSTSTKKAKVLRTRNKRISKRAAEKIVKVFNDTKDKQAARDQAVKTMPWGAKKEPATQPTPTSKRNIDEERRERVKQLSLNFMFPTLDRILSANGGPLWDMKAPTQQQKKEMEELLAQLAREHNLMLSVEPKDEFHSCVLLGALNLIAAQLEV